MSEFQSGWFFWIIKHGGSMKPDRYSKKHYFQTEGRTACGRLRGGQPLRVNNQADPKGRCETCLRLAQEGLAK